MDRKGRTKHSNSMHAKPPRTIQGMAKAFKTQLTTLHVRKLAKLIDKRSKGGPIPWPYIT